MRFNAFKVLPSRGQAIRSFYESQNRSCLSAAISLDFQGKRATAWFCLEPRMLRCGGPRPESLDVPTGRAAQGCPGLSVRPRPGPEGGLRPREKAAAFQLTGGGSGAN